MNRDVSRRQVLAGIGVAGSGVAGVAFLSDTTRAYTHYTYASSASSDDSTGERGLRVSWWQSYNGRFVSASGSAGNEDGGSSPEYVSDGSGPVLDAGNVLPGDEGRLAIGLQADIPEGESVAVWFRTALLATSENGVNGPERRAGDDPDDDGGELPENATVTVWSDTGPIGGCDGQFARLSPMEPLVGGGDGSGTLESVFGAFDGGHELACLESGESTCLGLYWELPTDVGNVVQGDSVRFVLSFRSAPCDGGNPFEGGDE